MPAPEPAGLCHRVVGGGEQVGRPALVAGDACGECAACRRMARRVHADLVVIQPGDTGTIKIEQVRDVIDRAGYRPFEGRRRVVIVDEADALVPAAQNALLKTLEEPPSASIFVLVSSLPDALLPTVQSRCPRLRFAPLSASDVAEVLMRDHGYAEADARAAAVDRVLLVHALEMADDPAAPRETFFSWVSRAEAEYGLALGLASIGALALAGGGVLPALVAAAGGAALGGALGGMMHRHHVRRVQEQLARGGLLLWVNVRDAAQETSALEILAALAAHDVHVHELAA